MDQATVAWAQRMLRNVIQSFADDPYGYCGRSSVQPGWDIEPRAAWEEIDHIGKNTNLDVVAVLHEVATPVEIERLRKLTGLELAQEPSEG